MDEPYVFSIVQGEPLDDYMLRQVEDLEKYHLYQKEIVRILKKRQRKKVMKI